MLTTIARAANAAVNAIVVMTAFVIFFAIVGANNLNPIERLALSMEENRYDRVMYLVVSGFDYVAALVTELITLM